MKPIVYPHVALGSRRYLVYPEAMIAAGGGGAFRKTGSRLAIVSELSYRERAFRRKPLVFDGGYDFKSDRSGVSVAPKMATRCLISG